MICAIGFLIFPDFQILDATGPISAFDIAGRYVPGAYQLRLLATEPGLVRSTAGVALQAEGIDGVPALETLLVSGGDAVRAIERLRVEAARARIEDGSEPIDTIATAVGFGDPERMRRAFVRAFGQPPQALRRSARS